MTARRILLFAIKLAVTAGLLAWVFTRVALGDVAARLRSAHPGWIAAAFLLGAINVSLGALRWRLVLAALGAPLPLGETLRHYWSSLFFNGFLPTGVVGDALRGAWAARAGQAGRAYFSVVLDRVTALLALALVAGVALLLPTARALPAALGIGLGCVALGGPAAFVLAFPQIVPRLLARIGRNPGLDTAPPRVRPRVAALALAAVLHVLTIATTAALARASLVDVPLSVLFVVVPAVTVAAFMPVSISGIGVRDVAMVELLAQAGVPAASALALSVPFLGITVGLSLLGGLVYLLGGRRAS